MEPERRIEKLLRAYADRRRREGGSPPELTPVTRRLLQSEAARRAAGARDTGASAGWLNFLRVKWPWTLAGATAVVLVGFWAIHSLEQGGRPETLALDRRVEESREVVPQTAQEKKAEPAVLSGTAAADNISPAAAGPALDKSKALTAETKVDSFKAPAAAPALAESARNAPATASSSAVPAMAPPAPPPVTTAQPLAEMATRKPAFDQSATASAGSITPAVTLADHLNYQTDTDSLRVAKDANASTVVVVTPMSSALQPGTFNSDAGVAGAAAVGGTVAEAEAPAAQRQRFYRTPAVSSKALAGGFRGGGGGGGFGGAGGTMPDVSMVLTNFVAVRTNNLLQFFDADGSVYQGNLPVNVENAVALSAAPAGRAVYDRVGPAPNAATTEIPFAGFAFTVSGTNVTLNRLVNFTGSFAPQPAVMVNSNFRNRTFGPAQATPQAVSYPRLSGVLTIDGEAPVHIDAAPAPTGTRN